MGLNPNNAMNNSMLDMDEDERDIKTDVVRQNNRETRRNYNVNGNNTMNSAYKNPSNNNANLLLGDIPGYKVDNRNILSGDYNNSIKSYNNKELLVKNQFSPSPSNNNNNSNSNNNSNNSNNNIRRFNRNNLITKNPFPGNDLDLTPDHVQYSNNVNSYNRNNLITKNPINRKRCNIGNIIQEGFQSNGHSDNITSVIIEIKTAINNAIDKVVDRHSKGEDIRNSLKTEVISEINNSINKNNVVSLKEVQNDVENAIEDAVEEAVNHIEQSNNNYVDPNNVKNKVKNALNNAVDNSINNAVKSNNINVLPKNPLFYSPNRLNSIQNRKIRVQNKLNKGEMVSGSNMFSAQGYNSNSEITGFNKYGAESINYLCLSKQNPQCQ